MFFVLPIRDEPNPPGRAWVTYGLMATNILVFLYTWPLMSRSVDIQDPAVWDYVQMLVAETGQPARLILRQTSAYDILLYTYGFRPAEPSVLTLFTSMFLHGGWMHVGFNMLFLWIFGDNVEYHLGRLKYGLAYLAMGVAATLLFALFSLGSPVPMVGASGAISGVLGCYFLWFPRNRVKVLTVVLIFVQIVAIPARWILGFYIIVANLIPFLLGEDSGVAYAAHIGGFLGGLGIAYYYQHRERLGTEWSARRFHRSAPKPDLGDFREVPREPALVEFYRALQDENWEQAVREYALMPVRERNRLSEGDVFRLVDGLERREQFKAALAVIQGFIATHPNSPKLAGAHLRAGLIQLRGLVRPTAAFQHLLATIDLNPTVEEEQLAREALQEIEQIRRRRDFH